jgi:hypothetical protein
MRVTIADIGAPGAGLYIYCSSKGHHLLTPGLGCLFDCIILWTVLLVRVTCLCLFYGLSY